MDTISRRHALQLAGGVLAGALAVGAAQAQESTQAQARLAYEQARWQVAFKAFAELADRGDAEAARVAALMHLHGPQLYGEKFEVDLRRLNAWLTLAARHPRAEASILARAPLNP